ncbi:hypothetical protein ZEAMMB73_Zm00001d012479 [Zea mays]|uniref:Uncharacterized protein n=1 Tax=Zea mays TaxID=4577 RepID=A0A1D6G904_MAIZE|nr:hypothetical protein ZEAMMB73_Zm00001d012479 [Zea mays]AQK99620.1 hypothetical protein ZEAMMB73_Zm00001d012479 [Zea mays]AQK99621.1 hypothetical protein ZEAMMB73_Zm00001d012479 [Zea mays]
MQRHDFVNQRCATLQRYLRRLAVVGHSPVLHASLTATGPNGIPTSDGGSPRWSPPMSAATCMAAAAPMTPTESGSLGETFFGCSTT